MCNISKYIYIAIFTVVTSLILIMVLSGLSILPYQSNAYDAIINNICMGLTFQRFDHKYQSLCKYCIKCQNCCFKIKTNNETHIERELKTTSLQST